MSSPARLLQLYYFQKKKDLLSSYAAVDCNPNVCNSSYFCSGYREIAHNNYVPPHQSLYYADNNDSIKCQELTY